jgi:hypothetical protein
MKHGSYRRKILGVSKSSKIVQGESPLLLGKPLLLRVAGAVNMVTLLSTLNCHFLPIMICSLPQVVMGKQKSAFSREEGKT